MVGEKHRKCEAWYELPQKKRRHTAGAVEDRLVEEADTCVQRLGGALAGVGRNGQRPLWGEKVTRWRMRLSLREVRRQNWVEPKSGGTGSWQRAFVDVVDSSVFQRAVVTWQFGSTRVVGHWDQTQVWKQVKRWKDSDNGKERTKRDFKRQFLSF